MTAYRVCGAMPVLGHAPGEEFEADLDSGQEARLFQARALMLAADYEPPAPPPKKRKSSTSNPSPDAAPAPDSEEK